MANPLDKLFLMYHIIHMDNKKQVSLRMDKEIYDKLVEIQAKWCLIHKEKLPLKEIIWKFAEFWDVHHDKV